MTDMLMIASSPDRGVSTLRSDPRLDASDAKLLAALARSPRATVLSLATVAGLSRNTVQARLAQYESRGVLRGFEHCIEPAALGYPMTAFVMATVTQQLLAEVVKDLAKISEVIEVTGLSGSTDLLIHVVARDADDLYRVAGQILAVPGVGRTDTFLSMRRLVGYRVTPLLERVSAGLTRGNEPSAG